MLMFCLKVELLTSRYYATDHTLRAQAEWPPHPSRLFSALVDAWAGLGQPGEGEEALEWLERQTPPALTVSERSKRDTVESFVPVNDEESLPAYRLRQSRHFPSVTPEKTDVHFIWPEASPTPAQVAALMALAAGVTYLGHSASKVVVSAVENAPEPNFIPDASGDSVLRVPAAGRFRSLCEAWELDRRPSVGRTYAYRRLDDNSQPTSTAASEFSEVFLFRRVEGRTLMLEQTLALTEAVRGTLLKLAQQPAPACLHGHNGDSHVALFPLAFVGRPHADGHIMGFALALPKSLSRSERSAALAAAAVLSKTKLEMGRLGDWIVERVGGDETATTLQRNTWIRSAQRWASVTPVLFDRFPKAKPGKTPLEVLTASCRRIGLPAPATVEVSPHPHFDLKEGVPPACAFQTRRVGVPTRLASHVVLVFPKPVRGPILLGAGRYFGLGLFRPLLDTP
jgi:CRISPR-associated protein Csb2